jgi:fermentation-respiration switch protein FrsA (DUF1100 family)
MRQDIEFKSEGVTCRGWFFTPDEGKPPFPCITMAMGANYVKEFPIIKVHTEEFIRHGLACVVFDYRSFGASDGLPRQHLDGPAQVEDCRNAISLAETLPNVDRERLGLWGTSLGGGHALIVAAMDSRIKCTVSIFPVADGYDQNRGSRGNTGMKKLAAAILEDRRKRIKDETHIGYMPSVAQDENEVCYSPTPSSYGLYMHCGKIAPAWENRVTIQSAEIKFTQSVWPFLPRILTMPLLEILVEGDLAVNADAIKAYNLIPSPRKKILIIPSDNGKVNHATSYTQQSHTQLFSKPAAEFFVEHLVEPYNK